MAKTLKQVYALKRVKQRYLAKRHRAGQRMRFNKLARAICPNHLTAKQYVGLLNISTGLGTASSGGNITNYFAQGVTAQSFAIGFAVKDVPQIAQWAALFDRYKIVKVKLTFKPQFNVSDLRTDTTNLGYAQTLLTTLDYDDIIAPASLDYLRDYQSCRDHGFYKTFSIELKPRIAVGAYAAGVFGSYMNTTGWIDMASTSVEHYGIKGVVSPGLIATLQCWTIEAEYIIDFKNIR